MPNSGLIAVRTVIVHAATTAHPMVVAQHLRNDDVLPLLAAVVAATWIVPAAATVHPIALVGVDVVVQRFIVNG